MLQQYSTYVRIHFFGNYDFLNIYILSNYKILDTNFG